jgi:hypothetical protein
MAVHTARCHPGEYGGARRRDRSFRKTKHDGNLYPCLLEISERPFRAGVHGSVGSFRNPLTPKLESLTSDTVADGDRTVAQGRRCCASVGYSGNLTGAGPSATLVPKGGGGSSTTLGVETRAGLTKNEIPPLRDPCRPASGQVHLRHRRYRADPRCNGHPTDVMKECSAAPA